METQHNTVQHCFDHWDAIASWIHETRSYTYTSLARIDIH